MPKHSLSEIDRQRIDDIVTAIAHVKRYCRGVTGAQFSLDPQVQDAVIRRLTIIGEAASKLSLDAKSRYADIPWDAMIGMRHILVHDYGRSDVSILWRTVKIDLPMLEKALRPK
jgi:uncharacterized protein with HEPN domain